MTEWGVVGVIVVLLGLVGTIVTPLIKLNTSIVKLTVKLDAFGEDLAKLTAENGKSHDRIWRDLEEKDTTLEDHEHRIYAIEVRNK